MDLKNELEALRTGLKAENRKDVEAVQSHVDKLDVKIQSLQKGYSADTTGAVDELKTLFKNKTNEIKSFNGDNLNLKVAGTITTASALTGDGMRTYSTTVASAPNQLVNFADLIPSIKSDTNTFTYPLETPAVDGAFADATEDTTKSQLEYKLEMVDVVLSYLAGFVKISRTMINNVPFVQNWLPQVLKRDYTKAENSKFMASTIATVTASTLTTGNEVERLTTDSAKLMALSYMPDVIVVNPVDYANILLTAGTSGTGAYSLPGSVSISNGSLLLNGLRIVPANWIAANKYLIMDSSYFLKVYSDGFNVKVFESNEDDAIKNNITLRAEQNIGFAITRSDAAIYGDFTTIA